MLTRALDEQVRATLAVGVTAAVAAAGLAAWSAPPAAAAVPSVTATLVRTVATSGLTPPIPDPAGIVYVPERDRFLIADSEVDETPIYQGSNIFETTRAGAVVDRGVTTAYTKEAAGIGYDPGSGHVFVSDDDQFRVYEVDPGADGRAGTADDTRTSFSTAAFGSTDPEDVTFFPPTGELFVLDGADHDVHRVGPGPNGRFDGVAPTGDDVATEVDVQRLGAEDPEGIGYHPGRGTLLVVDSTSEAVYELNRQLMPVSRIDISASGQVFAAGITVAPALDEPARWDLYVVDRGVDNDADPDENDGKLYQLRATLPPIGNLEPVVAAGRDLPVVVGAPLALAAGVRDDGLPGPGTTIRWTRVSGPGTVTFSTPDAATTTARFTAAGVHVLRATASDGALTGSDDVTVTVVPAGAPLPLDTPVAKAFDDVEQRPTGYADWLGSSLNIPRAGTTAQTIGIRFDDLLVPEGATITEAWVQFRATGSNSAATDVTIAGIAQDDTATFTTSSTTVSSRPRTAATVSWSPPAWSSGQAGAAQRTADLRTVVQAVVGRPGWRSGNALALVMTGTGERRASSHDGATPPVLHVAYTLAGPSNTPPTASFTASCSGTTCSFDAGGSSDAEGPVAGYRWTFSDGGSATGVSASRTFAAPGTYQATLTVTDSAGATGSTTQAVTTTSTASAIGFRGVARAAGNTTAATLRVPTTVQAEDALLLFGSASAGDTGITPPSGWTQVADVRTGSSQRTLVWSRVATAADAGSSVTLRFASLTKVALQLVAYRGTSPTAPLGPVATRSETTATTSHTTPTATVAGSGSWVVSYWADKSSTTTDWSPPASVVSRDESIGSGSGRIGALVADSGGPVPAGAAGGLTATTDVASRAALVTVVLRPR
ncbi:PKD domain-containing protein [Nocardioides marmotae]|uniref:PKD domain-containing protein n=1 Tax=Nocardioides marmotae TaxID=2663857 RepID=UPI0012B569D3|nr:PKD domain-containing protein [Nocardioides marmotae]MBC9735394.1 PKD domain-containing protein [Nocardioides marmotae]MTB86491.1 PKD domain-containing protein [Nocardioides marmotae]